MGNVGQGDVVEPFVHNDLGHRSHFKAAVLGTSVMLLDAGEGANADDYIGVDMVAIRTFYRWMADRALKQRCTFCGGLGHLHKQCMTLIECNRQARSVGLGFHWGAIKGFSYFESTRPVNDA